MTKDGKDLARVIEALNEMLVAPGIWERLLEAPEVAANARLHAAWGMMHLNALGALLCAKPGEVVPKWPFPAPQPPTPKPDTPTDGPSLPQSPKI